MHKLMLTGLAALVLVGAGACSYRQERVVQPAPSTTQRTTTVTADPMMPATTSSTTTTTR